MSWSESKSSSRRAARPAGAVVALAGVLAGAVGACGLVVVDGEPETGGDGGSWSTSASTSSSGGSGGSGGSLPACPAAPPWSRSFGEPYDSFAAARTVDLDVGAVDIGCGPFETTGGMLHVAKIDPAGDCLWSRSWLGGIQTFPRQIIAADGAGGFVVGGQFSGKLDLGGGVGLTGGGDSLFVVALDAAGDVRWARAFDHPESYFDYLTSIIVDEAGSVILAGSFQTSIDFGGPALESAIAADVFVARLDASGEHVYSRAFHRLSADGQLGYPGPRVAMGVSGNVFVGGSLSGAVDFGAGQTVTAGALDTFLVALDPSGTPLWTRTFGAVDAEARVTLYGIVNDELGGVLVTGSFSSSVDFGGGLLTTTAGYAVFVAAYDGAGNHRYSHAFACGDGDMAAGMGIAAAGAGSALLTGDYTGTLDLGSGAMTSSAGGYDMFVARIPLP